MTFEFATATRIVFGRGTLATVGAEAAKLGTRALLVGGSTRQRSTPVVQALEQAGISTTSFGVAGEPGIADVQTGVSTARQQRCDLVVSVGGGSAIDAGKAIAAMLANPGVLMDYLEVIGRGKPLPNRSLPFIAIPTTAGTGSEVTRNAVLASPEHKVKVSLRGPGMLPALAVVDPDATRELPPAVTAATGMDALTQLIEPYVCSRPSPMTDSLCREGITRAARALPRVFRDGADIGSREDMCLASLFGGLALANAGLGAVHGLAGPLGGMLPAPHGAVCAALLPHVMAANISCAGPGSETLTRYHQVAKMLTGNPSAEAGDGVEWVRKLVLDLLIPPLNTYGMTPEHVADLAEKAHRSSSMKANPVILDAAKLSSILLSAL